MSIVGYETVDNGLFMAQRIPDTLTWGVGEIGAGSDQSQESQVSMARLALDSVVRVPKSEENATSCTDGRTPDRLGDPVLDKPDDREFMPVRPTLTGNGLGDVYYAFEGAGIFEGSKAVMDSKNPAERVRWTAEVMARPGVDLLSCAHPGCAACAGYGAVKENGVRFAGLEAFKERQRQTMPAGVYDQSVQDGIIRRQARQLNNDGYAEPTLDMFLAAAREVGGQRAIGNYVDDGRGAHGHVEEAIFRLRAQNHAVDTRKLNESGRQAFTSNDDMGDKMADRLAFSLGNQALGIVLRHAMNTHANAAHGTLTKNVPTWLVQKVSGRR